MPLKRVTTIPPSTSTEAYKAIQEVATKCEAMGGQGRVVASWEAGDEKHPNGVPKKLILYFDNPPE